MNSTAMQAVQREAAAELVVTGILVRNHEVETVHAATQKDHDERLAALDLAEVIWVEPRLSQQTGWRNAAISGRDRGGRC